MSVGAAPLLLAHGLGGRTDLPLPFWMFGYGAAAALIVSFVALGIFWTEPRLVAMEGLVVTRGRPALSRGLTGVAATLGLLAFGLVTAAAMFGTAASAGNLAPVAVFVIFWVGVTVVSGLVADVWPALNPFETIAGGLVPVDPRPYRLGHWPAAAGLFAFVWLELVYPDAAEPRILAVALLVYTSLVLAAASRWGSAYLDGGETFRCWFGLVGEGAPLRTDRRGALRLRPPFAGLARVVPQRGTVGLIVVALGSTAFDGLTRTTFWANLANAANSRPMQLVVGTLGLTWAIGAVALAYTAAIRVTARLTRDGDVAGMAADFAHSLVPIALGYALAHYVSLLLLEGQAAIALASDPFGRGWDLFGTARWTINFTLVSTTAIAWIQVAAIVVGHVAGVVLAHDRALVRFDRAVVTRSQYPLLAVMIAFTVTGLALLFAR